MDTYGLMGVESAECRLRDKDWFSSLYHETYRMLTAYARRRVDAQTADEVVADTFLVAWRRREDIPEGRERAWLFGVARNTIRTALRASYRRDALASKLRGGVVPDWADCNPEDGERCEPQLAALRSLREEDREILMLVAWEELSHAEIGHVLGLSPNAVAIRIHRARKRLAARIDETTQT